MIVRRGRRPRAPSRRSSGLTVFVVVVGFLCGVVHSPETPSPGRAAAARALSKPGNTQLPNLAKRFGRQQALRGVRARLRARKRTSQSGRGSHPCRRTASGEAEAASLSESQDARSPRRARRRTHQRAVPEPLRGHERRRLLPHQRLSRDFFAVPAALRVERRLAGHH